MDRPSRMDWPSVDAWHVATSCVLAVLSLLQHAEPISILLLYLAAVSPALWAADLAERRLPNRLVLPGYAAAGCVVLVSVVGRQPLDPTAFLSALAYFGFLLILAVFGGMGLGDVKLAGVLGFAAGALGPVAALASPLIAFLVGSAVALVAIVRGTGRSIAFGPCLITGFWVAVVLF